MLRVIYLIASGAVLLAAQTPVGGPSLGYVFDTPGQVLRPILGIPGASIFGDPVNSAPLSVAGVSLRQNVAIVNDGAWKAIGLTTAASGATVLPDGLAGALAAVSENGTAAAFYDAASSALSVVTGIASPSMAANPVALDSLPGAITAMAVSDDGSLLASSSLSGGGESLMWIGADGSVRQLASLQSTAAILVWNHGGNALVTDRAANQILQIQNPGGNAAIALLASDADGVSTPAGAALSADGKRLWIANAGAQSVLGIDLNSRTTVTLNCAFDITALVPLAGGASFRLNDLKNGPLWILDPTPGAERVVFVPPAQSATANQEAAQ
jgi:hypothetical protein